MDVSDFRLREVAAEDLPIFFAYQLDPDANWMAAFTAKDPTDQEAFAAHWATILADPTILARTIVFEGEVTGHVLSFAHAGEREVSYWIGKEHWGRGLATAALEALLEMVRVRPVRARAAKDNIGSIRVLEKCGFAVTGEDHGYANARAADIEEFVFTLA